MRRSEAWPGGILFGVALGGLAILLSGCGGGGGGQVQQRVDQAGQALGDVAAPGTEGGDSPAGEGEEAVMEITAPGGPAAADADAAATADSENVRGFDPARSAENLRAAMAAGIPPNLDPMAPNLIAMDGAKGLPAGPVLIDAPNRLNLPMKRSGRTSDAQVEAVVSELEKLPASVRQTLTKDGTQWRVGTGTVTDTLEVNGPVRGWDPQTQWNRVPGVAMQNPDHSHTVAISTLQNPAMVRAQRDGHNSMNLSLHETGHALSHHRIQGVEFQATPEFRKAWNETLRHANGNLLEVRPAYPQQKIDDRLRHYFDSPTSGPDETFAEGLARYYGSPESREVLRNQWPPIYRYFDTYFHPRYGAK